MKILFTGASSFTGYHFVRELAARGHEVTASFRRKCAGDYADTQKAYKRVSYLLEWGVRVPCFNFDPALLSSDFDLLCLHGAEVKNYASPEFDFEAAFNSNLRGIGNLLNHAKRVIVSRSVFELEPDPTPYARSKLCTFKVIETACANRGIPCQSFFIANPFGPLQDRGLFTEVCRDWAAGRETVLREPKAVRDQVFVDNMAAIYGQLVEITQHGRQIIPTGLKYPMDEFRNFILTNLNNAANQDPFWRTIREEYKP